ncbi:MAG TPA: bifunctional tetrahydrofolate synthase/dihydrofolate synthase [Gammaproteobacteria bacterium]|nr:bifunctional tetrahydrofolate synthase/dihydrofolate synthase [Gammaproteobacteria bacterium]
MHLSTLSSWLDWIGSVHNKEIDLGLDRIRIVAERLGVLTPACPVIIVGGTNGKGSVVAGLESIYRAAGYRTGAFTSPYLFVHNEEVRVDGVMAEDGLFCQAFEKIESARDLVTLTPFEYHTLAALIIFADVKLDVMILEVGLGGRLDAVNVINPDISIVTSIGIDHIDWLGETREKIAVEKAGIFRRDRPAICGDANPPDTLYKTAADMGAVFFQQGKDFKFVVDLHAWSFQSDKNKYQDLPRNQLLTQNMATVVMAMTLLQEKLPVKEDALRQGLKSVSLPGRMQIMEGEVTEIYDVAHNPHAAVVLAARLRELPCRGKTLAVFSMLDDKDIAGTIKIVRNEFDSWYVAPLACKRAAPLEKLKMAFQSEVSAALNYFDNITDAYRAAKKQAKPGDRIVIFGSFYTVAAIMPSSLHQL